MWTLPGRFTKINRKSDIGSHKRIGIHCVLYKMNKDYKTQYKNLTYQT